MKLLNLLILCIYFLLAPLANAEIREHVEGHHQEAKVHTHSSKADHHGNSHTHDKDESDHDHKYISIEDFVSNDSTSLDFIVDVVTLESSKQSHQNLKVNFNRVHIPSKFIVFYKKPSRYRSLPLVI